MEIFLCVINVVINACMQEPYTSVSSQYKKVDQAFLLAKTADIFCRTNDSMVLKKHA